jgi:hypothetical protein
LIFADIVLPGWQSAVVEAIAIGAINPYFPMLKTVQQAVECCPITIPKFIAKTA